MSTVITIRLSKELKKAMQRFTARADWPEYLRNVISQKIRQLELEDASRAADDIRKKTKPGAYDSADSIRRDRGR